MYTALNIINDKICLIFNKYYNLYKISSKVSDLIDIGTLMFRASCGKIDHWNYKLLELFPNDSLII